jgi:uncharacterized protein (TIGR02757 family)
MLAPGLSDSDFEILSFVAAGLAYGRVEQIRKSYADLLFRLKKLGCDGNGAGISQVLKSPDAELQQELSDAFQGWKHRLNTSSDIVCLFLTLSRAIERRGSLCRVFQNNYQNSPKDHIVSFCDDLLRMASEIALPPSPNWKGTGVGWFLTSPKDGSTCKRLLMWLRWMIRKDSIDPGIWQKEEMQDEFLPAPSASRLFMPLDAHVFSWAQENGIMLGHKTPNWKSTEIVTEFFQHLDPEDPIRFDFAICHMGMSDFRKIKSANEIRAGL